MPMFKVTLSKHSPPHHGPMFNPFLIRDLWAPSLRGSTTFRTWEFEAVDEDDVRRLFAEARAQRISQVEGFELASIEQIDAWSYHPNLDGPAEPIGLSMAKDI